MQPPHAPEELGRDKREGLEEPGPELEVAHVAPVAARRLVRAVDVRVARREPRAVAARRGLEFDQVAPARLVRAEAEATAATKVAELEKALVKANGATEKAVAAALADAGPSDALETHASLYADDLDAYAARFDCGGVAYKAVRAPRAENLPLSEISGRLAGAGLPKDTPVYVICHSGNRSRRAAQIMRQAGYDAINVMGGTSEWMRKGHKTTQG